MSTHLEFARAGALTGGAKTRYGTAYLRAPLGSTAFFGVIGLGHIESFDKKDVSVDEEGYDESGAHDFFLMLDQGEEVSLTCRFPADLPAPAKGMFLQFNNPGAYLEGSGGEFEAELSVDYLIITEAAWKAGNREIRKYTITGKRWDSLTMTTEAGGAVSGEVTTSSGAVTGLTGRPAAGPVSVVAPVISPDPSADATLMSCTPGTWTNGPVTLTYQWKRSGTNISGATSPTYTTQPADVTETLTCLVVATNVVGATSANSNAVYVDV